jgi:arabinogalactan oligomer / maltooligosaccharide transport system substrate-binding protein
MSKWTYGLMAGLLLGASACGSEGNTDDDEQTGDGDDGAEQITLTLWHGYHAGGGEEKALLELVENYKADGVKVEVVAQTYEDLIPAWKQEVNSGKATPHLYVNTNDDFGNQVRSGLVADITAELDGRLDGYVPAAIDGLSYEGKVYAVPVAIKAIALCYKKSALTSNVPTTMEDLLALLSEAGGHTLSVEAGAYHLFPLLTDGVEPFGAQGQCVMNADGATAQAGLREAATTAFELLRSPGARVAIDYQESTAAFTGGEADMYVCGPWELKDLQGLLGDDLGVTPFPGGRALAGVDGWFVNPNATSAERKAAVDLALALSTKEAQELYAKYAGTPSVRSDVEVDDPLVGLFADAAAGGFTRPQSEAFGQYWGPFGTMFKALAGVEGTTATLEEAARAADLACKSMNDAIEAASAGN